MDFSLSDEQRDFVAAIRDFCERECGTQEKREALTGGYTEHHNFDLYRKMAELAGRVGANQWASRRQGRPQAGRRPA